MKHEQQELNEFYSLNGFWYSNHNPRNQRNQFKSMFLFRVTLIHIIRAISVIHIIRVHIIHKIRVISVIHKIRVISVIHKIRVHIIHIIRAISVIHIIRVLLIHTIRAISVIHKIRVHIIHTIRVLLLSILPLTIHAQDIEAITKAKPIKVSGGFGTEHAFYDATGIQNRRNLPYQYFITGNINFSFFSQLNIPLSFTYSNQKFNYSKPFNQQQFNQFGLSPRYKWVTVHAGWRNMTFSPYSLNGHTFLGGGVELTPGKFTIGAMYGRLLKAVEYDSTLVAEGGRPAYERYGMGVNVKMDQQGNQYGFSFFRSADTKNSLTAPPDSIGLTPEENLVWSAQLRQKISKLTIEGEYGNTTITRDSRFEDNVKAYYFGTIQENSTTVSYQAYKAKATYQLKKAKIGAGFEHIDPNYRTHGAYYFNNDLESISALFSSPFFKDKVNVSIDLGTQRNNLDKSKISTMRRWVTNTSVGFMPSDKWNLTLNYSNFQTYTNMRSPFTLLNTTNPYQNIDTLNYVQITQSAGANANFILRKSAKNQQNLGANFTVQKANEEQGDQKLPTGSVIYNANSSYTYSLIPRSLTFQLAANGNWNELSTGTVKTLGPTAGASKQFLKKKLKTNLTYSWNTTLNNNTSTGYVGVLRLTNTITLKKKHNISISGIWLNRETKNTTTSIPTFNEYTARIGYNYRF